MSCSTRTSKDESLSTRAKNELLKLESRSWCLLESLLCASAEFGKTGALAASSCARYGTVALRASSLAHTLYASQHRRVLSVYVVLRRYHNIPIASTRRAETSFCLLPLLLPTAYNASPCFPEIMEHATARRHRDFRFVELIMLKNVRTVISRAFNDAKVQ